jgi:hypothetical protein
VGRPFSCANRELARAPPFGAPTVSRDKTPPRRQINRRSLHYAPEWPGACGPQCNEKRLKSSHTFHGTATLPLYLERSRGICSSADLSWKHGSRPRQKSRPERSVVERSGFFCLRDCKPNAAGTDQPAVAYCRCRPSQTTFRRSLSFSSAADPEEAGPVPAGP